MARGLFAALFPSDCRLCNAPLENISRLPVREECLAAIRSISGEICEICGEALSGVGGTQACNACQQEIPHFDKAVAFGAYDNELRDLIHLLKYEHVRPAGDFLARLLGEAILKLKITGPVLVVPVPLYRSKRRQRRFNQAEVIARLAFKRLRGADIEFVGDVLKRVRPTQSQIGLTRPQRRENVRGTFQVVHQSKVRNRSILLVDDVLTTGTTANECARVLRKAQAEKVYVATVARTLKISGGSIDEGESGVVVS
jgi:ComF family protein